MENNDINENTIVCVNCPRGCRVRVQSQNGEITNITGYQCDLGIDYAKEEFKNPTRILPTTVRVKGGELELVPVKTARPIPKSRIGEAMRELAGVKVQAPVKRGEVVVEDIAGTGIEVVATRSIALSQDQDNTGKKKETS